MQNWGHRLTEQNLINERSISITEEQRSRRHLDHCCFSKTHFSTHSNIHIQLKSKSILFVRPEPRDEFTEPKFADGLSFTDPLIEKQSGGILWSATDDILLYSLFIVSVHGYFVLLVGVFVDHEGKITYQWLSSITPL